MNGVATGCANGLQGYARNHEVLFRLPPERYVPQQELHVPSRTRGRGGVVQQNGALHGELAADERAGRPTRTRATSTTSCSGNPESRSPFGSQPSYSYTSDGKCGRRSRIFGATLDRELGKESSDTRYPSGIAGAPVVA